MKKFWTSKKSPNPGSGSGLSLALFNPLAAKTIWEAIDALINFLLLLSFTIAPLLVIYAAFLILTASGNPERINRGKAIIFWAIIGLLVILLAKALPSAIKGALGG